MASRQLLDVEDDDARQQRIQSLLEATAASAAPRPAPSTPSLPPTRPHAVPPSALLSRAAAFLPQLAAANAALDPASADIEHPEGPHIEMNLGLGVFEQRPRPRSRAPSTSDASTSSSSSSPSESEDSEDDAEGESDPGAPQNPAPRIQVLAESSTPDTTTPADARPRTP